MRLRHLILLLVLLALPVISGCQATPRETFAVEPTEIGEPKAFPERIISLAPSNTEIVYALGLEDKLVGVTSYCNYPPAVKDKPVVSEFSDVDIEKIVSLEPDLILADSIHKSAVIPALESLGIPVLLIDPTTLEEILDQIMVTGNAVGREQETDSLVSSLRQRTEAVTARTAGLSGAERPRAFVLSWHDPLWVAGSGTLTHDQIIKAGGVNIAGDLTGHSQMDLESIIQRNPQVIFVLSSMGDQNTSLDYIMNEPRFQATDALKNGRVYSVDTDVYGRATPRSFDALEEMARLMHPDIFK